MAVPLAGAIQRRTKTNTGGINPQAGSVIGAQVDNRVAGTPTPGAAPGTIPGESAPVAWSYDPNYSEGMRRALEQRANLEFDYGVGQRRLGEDYTTSADALGRNRDDTLQALKDRLASQGILQSGINISEQGRIQSDYGRSLQDLNTQKARAQEDSSTGLARGEQNIQSVQNQLEIERARSQAQIEQARAQAEAQRQANQQLLQQIQAMMPSISATGQYLPRGY